MSAGFGLSGCPVPGPGGIEGRGSIGLVCEAGGVVGRVGSGLIGLYMEDVFSGKVSMISRNSPGLGGVVSPGLERSQGVKAS